MKGIAEPLQVFRLLSATDRPSWIVRSGAKALSTFVGREDELAQLSLALGRAWAGRAQAVALVADAGMGKSRLLHEFLGNLAQGAWHVMRVETTAQSTAIPYFLITALLREFVGCSQEDTTAEVAAWLPSVIASLGLDPQFDTTPLLAHLDREVDEVGFDKTDPLNAVTGWCSRCARSLLRYADLHPLILVVEDYHWLDASSVEVLDELFGEMDAVSARPAGDDAPRAPPGWRHLTQQGDDDSLGPRTEIELKHLTAGQADHLLRELIGGSDELAPLARIYHRTGRWDALLPGRICPDRFTRSGAIAGGAPRLTNIVIPASVAVDIGGTHRPAVAASPAHPADRRGHWP